LYKETFNKRRIILLLCLIAVLAIFHAVILPGIVSFVKAVFNPLDEEDTFTTLCIVALFLYAVGKASEQVFFKKNWPSLTSIVAFLSIGIYYWLCYRSDPTWVFFKLFSTAIYLTDLLLVSLFLLTADFIHLQSPLKEGPSALFSDDPSKVENDLLGRDQYIEKVRDAIKHTVADRAIGISILAEWGFGKTVFMNLLKNRLEEDPETIIIEFNPWIGERSQSTIKYFFEVLENELQKYDSSASRKISQYTNDLLQPVEEDNLWTKLAKTGTNILFPGETTIQEKKDAINRIITRIGKRIVILLDDLDRLNGEELSDVMRLIRNTADFKQTFFVAALDRNYVLNALKESNMVESRDRYLEKIFQLEIVLPPIRKNIVLEQLLLAFSSIINDENKAKKDKGDIPVSELEEVMKDLWDDEIVHNPKYPIAGLLSYSLLDQCITNIRDVNRFANSFRIVYEMIKESVQGDMSVLKEFFLLELIKFKAPSLYNLFANKVIFERPKNGQRDWKLNGKKFENILDESSAVAESLSISKIDRAVFKQIIETLFTSSSPHLRSTSVRMRENHSVFFNYSNRISVFGLLNRLGKGFSSMKAFIDELAKKDITPNKKDIEAFILTMDEMKDTQPPEHYQLMLKSLLYCEKYFSHFNLLQFILYYFSKNNLEKVYGDNVEPFNKFLKEDVFKTNNLSLEIRHFLASELVIQELRGNTQTNKLTQGEAIRNISKSLFFKYLDSEPKNEKKEATVYFMLSRTWGTRDEETQRVKLENDACLKFREYLKDHHRVYVQRLIRSHTDPEKVFKDYIFDPLIPQIFGGYSEFKEFLFALPSTTCIEYNKKKFIEFEQNGYNPIIIYDFEKESPCRQSEGELETE